MKKITFILSICSLLLIGCKEKPLYNTKITAKTIAIDSVLPENESISDIIQPYKDKMLSEINTVISFTPKDLTRSDGNLQSTLGNLLADLCYKRANPIFNKETGKNIDFALFNYGGIRASINKGKVTNRHAFELMPFENSLVVVELSGEKVMELVAYFIKNKKAHPLSNQIQLILSDDDSYELFIKNKKFDKTKNYFVLTSDYLQSGGDRMNFFKNPINLFKTDYKMRTAIMDEFKSLDTLQSNLDKRIIIK